MIYKLPLKGLRWAEGHGRLSRGPDSEMAAVFRNLLPLRELRKVHELQSFLFSPTIYHVQCFSFLWISPDLIWYHFPSPIGLPVIVFVVLCCWGWILSIKSIQFAFVSEIRFHWAYSSGLAGFFLFQVSKYIAHCFLFAFFPRRSLLSFFVSFIMCLCFSTCFIFFSFLYWS